MKIKIRPLASAVTLTALVLPTSVAQTYQKLGDQAAFFDFFLTNGVPGLAENDSALEGTSYLEWYIGNIDGTFALGRDSWPYIFDPVVMGSNATLYGHSFLYDELIEPTGGNSTNVRLGLDDALLDTANSQINAYIANLDSLTATQTFGVRSTPWTFTTSPGVNVLDFAGFNMSNDDIVLNGTNPDDVIVIRIGGDALFTGGTSVTLNNLNRRNVIWYVNNDGIFDLHKNNDVNFEGVIINNTSLPTTDYSTILGDVNFSGQVYASNLKVGSGIVFTGSGVTDPIPEPSAMLLLLSGITGMVFFRRRR